MASLSTTTPTSHYNEIICFSNMIAVFDFHVVLTEMHCVHAYIVHNVCIEYNICMSKLIIFMARNNTGTCITAIYSKQCMNCNLFQEKL